MACLRGTLDGDFGEMVFVAKRFWMLRRLKSVAESQKARWEWALVSRLKLLLPQTHQSKLGPACLVRTPSYSSVAGQCDLCALAQRIRNYVWTRCAVCSRVLLPL